MPSCRHRRPHPTPLAFALALVLALGVTPSCEGDGGGASGDGDVAPQLRTATAEITLGPEEGLVFATGEHRLGAAANVRSVDLVAFAHGSGLKLESGSPDGAMVVLRPSPQSRPQVFDTLAEVPDERPERGAHDLLIDPGVGHACVVLGNVTDGHARVRVKAVHEDGAVPRVTIEYAASWYE